MRLLPEVVNAGKTGSRSSKGEQAPLARERPTAKLWRPRHEKRSGPDPAEHQPLHPGNTFLDPGHAHLRVDAVEGESANATALDLDRVGAAFATVPGLISARAASVRQRRPATFGLVAWWIRWHATSICAAISASLS